MRPFLPRRSLPVRIAAGLALILLSGCATVQNIEERTSFDLSEKVVFYQDQWVQRMPPEVHVQPAEQPASYAPAVLFIPFRVTQSMDDPGMAGYATARIIWQTWLSMQIFPAMEFTGDTVPFRRDRALELGRLRNADIVIGGFVTHLYAGGTAGDSQLAVQIEAYDTRSGQMIWSMAQSGLMPASRTTDFFLFATRTRIPSNPLQAIAKVIAMDTGTILQNWISAPPPKTRLEKLDESARDALFPERDPVPPPRRPENSSQEQQAPRPAF
ncbi:MAG: hypothetical protein LBP61_07175 [Desulfovibrio sp.]|jgi:hypothetical protein|nr:hypothetical protein [Desulfovibrio sp.]